MVSSLVGSVGRVGGQSIRGLSPADEVDSTEEESTLTYPLTGATRSVKGRTITVTDPEDPAISHRVFVPDAPAQ